MEIRKLACVGAGLIGRGWATVFASKGYEVILQDQSDIILEKAIQEIESNLRFLQTNDLLDQSECGVVLRRIRKTTQIAEAVGESDYVQESVPDNYDIKKKVFKQMDAAAPAHTILASSSSGLLMTEIQKVVTRPERCVLVHPVLPVHLLPLVEVAGGQRTSPETCRAAFDLMTKMGKTPILLKREVSGYIVNRLQAALLREAIDLVDKGVATAEDVDKAFCMGIGLRDPIVGPFLRVHLTADGIERFLKDYAESYSIRWKDMETWTSIPPKAEQAVAEGVRKMEIIQTRELQQIKDYRDRMLVKILKIR